MKNAVVTGASGFIGRNLVRVLTNKGFYVTAFGKEKEDIFTEENIKYTSLDMQSLCNSALSCGKADIFYHFAWAGVSGDDRGSAQVQLRNILWTIDALNLCKQIGCKRFVCAGSIMEKETYAATLAQGSKPSLAYTYGAAKLTAHSMSKAVAASFGIDHIWAQITNVYGVGEVSPRFINTTLRKIINNEPLRFTSATQNYDFVYIDDAAEAFYRIGEYGKPFYEYTIGSSNAKPLKEFIVEMASLLCPDRELTFGDVPFTGINLPLSDFDCTETELDTGFKSKISFSEGIQKTNAWLKEHLAVKNTEIVKADTAYPRQIY
jgi:nucleoside-diphosphate-sugar epimerase